MIKLLRIDERLVHGQVAVVWTKYLGVDRIVVADDDAAENETQKYAMQMAVPDGVKLVVTTVEKAIALVNDPRAERLKIFLIAKNPDNVIKLVEQMKEKPRINVGNFGRMSGGSDADKISLERNLFVTEADAVKFKKLISMECDIFYQSVPDEKPTELKTLMGRKEIG